MPFSPGTITVAILSAATSMIALSACSGSSRTASGSSSRTTSAAGSAAPATQRVVSVALTADGCPADHPAFASGSLKFTIKNADATGVTELELLNQDRILGEAENLAPGFGGEFSLSLPPGTYTLYCPGAIEEKSTLTITGQAVAQANTTTHAALVQGATGYLGYVRGEVTTLVAQVGALDKAIKAGKVAGAQTAYLKARPYYERIEPVAESFGNLDSLIDSRVDAGQSVAKLTGFHRIEHDLFVGRSVAGLAPVSAALVANVGKLSALIHSATLTFQPAELANGAKGLLEEAASTKMTGEEEKYSHVDLLDLAANVEGSQQAFAYLEPGLGKIDASLVAQIRAAFTRLNATVARHASTTDPSGYVRYGQLTTADKRALSSSLLAVDGLLAQVAGKVVGA